MSAHEVLAEVMRTTLSGYAPLMVGINGVFDAPPARAVRPYAVIEEAVLADWSTKDMAGREGRLAVTLLDAGGGAARLRGLSQAVVDAVAGLPRELGEGWRIASLVFVRSRMLREGDRLWGALVEWRVRMLQVN